MAKRGAWYPLTQQGVQWSADGKPYYNTSDGRKDFIPPITAAQYANDPRMLAWARSQGATLATDPGGISAGTSVPGGSLLRERGTWNSETGQYDRGLNWANIGSLAVGGAMAAPFVAPLFAGGGAATGASSAAAAPSAGAAAGGATAAGAGITAGAAGAPTFFGVGGGAGLGGALSGGAAPGGGMGYFSKLGKFFNSPGGQAAMNLAGNLVGGAIQAGASKQATQAQIQAAREALDFAKQQYAKAQADWNTYQDKSWALYEPAAAISANALRGASEYATNTPKPVLPQSLQRYVQPGQTMPQPSIGALANQSRAPAVTRGQFPVNDNRPAGTGAPPAVAAEQIVTVQAPTGESRQMTRREAEHYAQFGARIVS